MLMLWTYGIAMQNPSNRSNPRLWSARQAHANPTHPATPPRTLRLPVQPPYSHHSSPLQIHLKTYRRNFCLVSLSPDLPFPFLFPNIPVSVPGLPYWPNSTPKMKKQEFPCKDDTSLKYPVLLLSPTYSTPLAFLLPDRPVVHGANTRPSCRKQQFLSSLEPMWPLLPIPTIRRHLAK